MNNYFVILAAGKSKRFHRNLAKQFFNYKNKDIIDHSVEKSLNSKLFKKIVRNNTGVCLALDPDVRMKATKIASLLNSYGVAVRMLNVEGFDDVGEMTKDEFLKFLSLAKPFGRDEKLLDLITSIKSGSII